MVFARLRARFHAGGDRRAGAGFNKDPGRFALATEPTRITFPYLLLISLVTLYGGILNALGRFATPAAAPILFSSPAMLASPA